MMIKTMVLVLALSGNALALECGLYYTYGTLEYAQCSENNQLEDSRRSQARLDQFVNTANAMIQADRQAAQQADASAQLQQLLSQQLQETNRKK